MRRRIVLGLAVVACGSSARERPTPSNPPAITCPPAPADLDTNATAAIAIDAPQTAALDCGERYDANHCTVDIPIVVTNCRADAIVLSRSPTLERIELGLVDIPHTLPPRTAWTLHATARGAGAASVALTVTSTVYRDWGYVDHGRTTRTWREPVVMTTPDFGPSIRITNPQLDAAMRACTACSGTWGIPHMMGVEQACNCRTKDAGKRCLDGDDCEGVCEFVKFEVVEAATGAGYAEGKCSERVYDPCVDYIPNSARARGMTASYEPSKVCE